MRIPFLVPDSVAGLLSRPFSSFGLYFSRIFPKLNASLKAGGVELTGEKYIRLSLFNALTMGFLFGLLFFFLSKRYNPEELIMVWGSVLTGLILFVVYFSYLILFPFWTLQRKAEEIDKNLLFAIRHLVVQTSAGVPLFDAISSASTGYGKVSEEFSGVVTKVNGGKDLSDALEESAERNPSQYYRRIMWQMANSARSGYATSEILSDLLEYLIQDQMTRLKKFGSELNILSVFYLSMCIILPTFGLIFIIIMSSFSLIMPNVHTLSMIIFLVAVFNLVFLGMIKSRRPAGVL